MHDAELNQIRAAWLGIAEGNLQACAILLRSGQFRAAAGRAYYAVFSACCAITTTIATDMIQATRAPGHRWVRNELPFLIQDSESGARPGFLGAVQACWNLRELDDYRCLAQFGEAEGLASQRQAVVVVETRRGLLP